MPESRTRKRLAKAKPPPKSQPIPAPWWKRHWKAVVGAAGMFAAIVGFASAVMNFLPRLTVEPGGMVDPSNPYPIPFMITNTGAVPITDVQPALGICEIEYNVPPHDLPERCQGGLRSFLAFEPWFVKTLAVDERLPIDLNDLIRIPLGGKFSAADISISVSYYPWFLRFWPFHATKEYRFQTKLEPDGKLWWKSRPVGK